jgi:hypothetical protein
MFGASVAKSLNLGFHFPKYGQIMRWRGPGTIFGPSQDSMYQIE